MVFGNSILKPNALSLLFLQQIPLISFLLSHKMNTDIFG